MGATPSAAGPTMLFDGWDELGRVLVMGVLGYAGLIVILRITGCLLYTSPSPRD